MIINNAHVRKIKFLLCSGFIGILFLSPYIQAQPNVVLIIVDALREDCVDAQRGGIPLMPFLANFPAARFMRASSCSSWTRPSMASIFSGTHVDTHQTHDLTRVLPESCETMAQYLQSAGYETLAVQTNGVAGASWGFSRGFDTFIFNSFAPADWVTATALSLVAATESPFFLYLHYNQPHVPYFPPEPYRLMMGYPHPELTANEMSLVENFIPYQTDYLRYHLGLQPELTFEQLSPIGCDAVRALYDGEVRFTDDSLAILLNNLITTHPDTVVIITADHGEHFWEHNSLGHVTSAYNELIHVPLIISVPGASATTVDTIVSHVDLLPTLSGLLNIPARLHWEGKDLFGPREPDGPIFANAKCDFPWLRDLEIIRLGDMKLIHEYKTGITELYDLSSDPGELFNLNESHAILCQELVALLHCHLLTNARANGTDSTIAVLPYGFIEEGMTVTLSASDGTGHVWFKNGVPLSDDVPRISGTNTPFLILNQTTFADTGVYECMYSDEVIHLNVTSPHVINVVPAESVSAHSSLGIIILAVLTILAALFRLGYRARNTLPDSSR